MSHFEITRPNCKCSRTNWSGRRLELENALLRFAELRDQAPVACLTHDENGFVFEANRRARALLGLQPCQDNFFLTSILTEQAEELFEIHIRRVRAAKDPLSMEFRLRKGGVREVPVLAETSKVDDHNFHTVMVDISRQKESELLRRNLDKHLSNSPKLEILHQLSGGVAHDFNNILQVMMLQAELAQSQMSSNANGTRQAVQEILKTAERGMELTRRLHAFSRKSPLEKVRDDLNEILEDSLGFVDRSIGENWQILFEPLQERLGVWVDPVQIEQVLLNLCLNSRDAMPTGGCMVVRTERSFVEESVMLSDLDLKPGNYAVISIIDQGTGIPEPVLARLFEPFFTTKPVGKGTGLGMSIVHSILRQHQGSIEVGSTGPTGTTIKVYLPSFQIQVTQVDPRKRRDECDENQLEGTVLICDDEPSILNVLSYSLQQQGLNVLLAQNGDEAARIIAAEDSIELLLTDMVLPDTEGREICRMYRGRFPNGAVVFMSGHGDSVLDKGYIHQVGATFLPKPFNLQDLRSKLGLNLFR